MTLVMLAIGRLRFSSRLHSAAPVVVSTRSAATAVTPAGAARGPPAPGRATAAPAGGARTRPPRTVAVMASERRIATAPGRSNGRTVLLSSGELAAPPASQDRTRPGKSR
jgi:hypothetical protein